LEVVTAVTVNNTVFWDVILCSLVEVADISEEHAASVFRVEVLPYATLKMEAVCLSETSVNLYKLQDLTSQDTVFF
jgi:hypothetical protein